MNMSAARTGYDAARRGVASPQTMEVSVLDRVTVALARASRDRDGDFGAYVEALGRNAGLWRFFASALAAPDNALPMELRQRLFALAAFVADETNRVLAGDTDADTLCEINRSILTGLREAHSAGAAR